jgi:hypothetical protein
LAADKPDLLSTMNSRKSLSGPRWITPLRLALVVVFTLLNAFAVITVLVSDDFPKTPDKWLVGSLTIVTVPVIFVAVLNPLLAGSREQTGSGRAVIF